MKLAIILSALLVATPALAAPSFVLVWQDNSPNEDGFQVERKVGAGAYSQIVTTAPNVTTATDAQVTLDVNTCFRLRAVNVQGVSNYSNEVCKVYPSGPPAAPTGLTVTLTP